MGLGMGSTCSTNYGTPAPAPNPDPKRWKLLALDTFPNAYVMLVQYLDCTNFEGKKIMLYEGKYAEMVHRDPHFALGTSGPVARFRPDDTGWRRARALAMLLL